MSITKIQLVKFALAISDALERTRPFYPSVVVSFVVDRLDFEDDNIAERVKDIVVCLKRDYPNISRA
jgi:hypothetical protein